MNTLTPHRLLRGAAGTVHRVAISGALLLASATSPGMLVGQSTAAPDSARLMTSLTYLASDELEGRGTGTHGAALAREFMQDAFVAAGLDTLPGGWTSSFRYERRSESFEGLNVLGWVRGTEHPDRFIVLTAHYDHVGIRRGEIYNGADDNASGSAALVELAFALTASPPRNSVILVALDAEEVGLRGARSFVADPPIPFDAIALNINMDMVGRGDGVLWAGGSYHTPALAPVLEAVAATAPVTLRLGHDRPNAREGADWTMQSDQGAFHQAGIPFVYFGVDDHPDYHRPTDDVETIDPANFVANVRTILAAVRALDEALPLGG